ncbi:MAG: glycosyltransferase [Saprospiraceae bacterium]|nr:glycosyltransferase [Saprospiraceae bacterium]
MYVHDIGIVIVNYNVRHFLTQCLQSIQNSKIQGIKLEVWIVDNASVDGSVSLIQKDFPDVHLIVNEKNVGFSAANNQAIKLLSSKYTLLLNPDTVLEEDTLYKCFTFMEMNPQAGAIGVRMIDGAGKFLPESKRKVPDIWNSFCKLSYLSELFPSSRLFSGYNLGYLPEMEVNEVEVLCGAFMFIRHSIFGEIGLLDEAFFMYGEDIDLSYRIIKAGHKIYYYPETSIIHYKGESTKKSSLNYVRTFYGAMHIYVNKHYSKENAGAFSILIKVAIILRALMSGMARMLQYWFYPILDVVLLFIVLFQVKWFWAGYYFGDPTYYTGTNIDTVLGFYIFVWMFSLWLTGHYGPDKSFIKTLTGILTGTMLILVCYALFPENLRTSRAIILMGSIVALLVTSLTSFFQIWFSSNTKTKISGKPSNIAIVALKNSAEKLIETIKKANVKYENIYVISPHLNDDEIYYTNTISALPSVVRDLKIDEVIYSNVDMTMKEIIHSMSTMDAKVSFKIGGDNSLNIIGSNSKNSQGIFYSIDNSYNLSNESFRKFKRIFDVLATLILFLLSPVLFFINNANLYIYCNMYYVFIGRKTWVGYGGEIFDYGFLPVLKSGVIKYPLASKVMLYNQDHFKMMNVQYAKDYTFVTDIVVLANNMYKLSNKT